MADEQITSSTANIPYINFINVGSDQAAPSAGRAILYIKSGIAYIRLDTGAPVAIGGAVALAEGQLAIGDGSGELAALALGTEGQVVTADASGFATWDDPPASGGGDLELIGDHLTGVGGEASYTFSAIAGTYKHLRLYAIARSDTASNTVNLLGTLNADGGNNYHRSQHYMTANVATLSQANGQSQASLWLGTLPGSTGTANRAGTSVIELADYAGTTFHKNVSSRSIVSYSDASGGQLDMLCHNTWLDTAAITSIALSPSAGNFVQGCRFTLYGLK